MKKQNGYLVSGPGGVEKTIEALGAAQAFAVSHAARREVAEGAAFYVRDASGKTLWFAEKLAGGGAVIRQWNGSAS